MLSKKFSFYQHCKCKCKSIFLFHTLRQYYHAIPPLRVGPVNSYLVGKLWKEDMFSSSKF